MEFILQLCMVSSDLYPDTIGGIGRHVFELVQGLNDYKDIKITVITKSIDGKPASEFYEKIKIIRYKDYLNIFGNSLSPDIFLKILKNLNKGDILHSHSHLFFSSNICALIKKIKPVHFVLTNHGIYSASTPDWINKFYMRTFGRWTLMSADYIICYTREEASQLHKNYNIPISKFVIILNGINPEYFFPLAVPKKENTILWVGRFVPGKGLQYLINACKILEDHCVNYNVLLVGDGPEKENIKKMIIDLNLIHRFSFINKVSYEYMNKIYNQATVFVLPSDTEGVPRTILEALCCEIPVIITEFKQLSDLILNCGFTIHRGDVIQLADRIETILSEPKLAMSMGKNGRKKVITYYNLKEMVRKTYEFYKSIGVS